jgi:ferredoxin
MIVYFTGTGNTRWAAQQLAEATGDKLCFIPDELRNGSLHYILKDDERLGICFPTHGWQPPRIVRDFLRRAVFENVHYTYALTTCGDNMGHAMRILRKELYRHALPLDAAFAVVMPESNVCFSFLHLDSQASEERKIAAAQERMPHICQLVVNRTRGVEELVKGAIPYTYTYVIGGYYNKHLITDSHFWVDEAACTQCGKCAKLCPVDDIVGKPPVWQHNGKCTNCLACYHYCPTHAIHWGDMQRVQYCFNRRGDQK